HPLFIIQANRLADLHRTHEGLTVHVVDINQVFNEFSGGTYDVPAIRDFVKMMYDRSNGDYPKYLLLFGDGSYDNKTESAANTNFIPTYQS
ncbi:C25 family cysteine peptidase, partial [Streptococcus pyogenes]